MYEYSNTEYPLTLFYNDYGKIHKVQFFDNNNLLWADINAVIEGGLPMIKIDYYEADGTIYHTQKFTENLYAETKTTTEQGCERVEVLHLTINHAEREEYNVTACNEYWWHDNQYTESGDYEYYTTLENGCQRVEILHLTINHSEREEYYENACDAYEWYGNTYTESGDYEYRSTLENGCERIEVLHLTIYNSQYEEYWETACDEYWWHGNQYTESGDYTYSYPLYNWGTGTCDRTEVLHLTINKRDTVHYYETACDEYWWDPYGQYYNISGDYENYTTNEYGCERVETLHLTINYSEYEEYWETACDEFLWHDNQYTESGDYEYHTTLENGCQRVEVLHLTINRSEREEYYETACDEYWWHDNQYTESGDYEFYTTNEYGCERVEVLHLTINHSEREEYYETACDEFYWAHNGETYYESGDYEYYTTTDQGCERVEVLHLTINKSERVEETVTSCDSYEWNGLVYTESGDYEFYTTTDQGCERIEVLHLTILPDATTESETLALCPSELPYDWYGQTLIEAGTYSATEQYAGMDCDSVIHELTLNVYVQTLPETVTLPIVRTGEAIDVTIPTAEIQAYIAAETWYAPNALVAWYVMENSDWATLTDEPVAAGITEVILKYAVETDCGNIESDKMVINLKTTDMENTQSQSPTSNCQKILYEDHIYILREGKIYSVMGHEL